MVSSNSHSENADNGKTEASLFEAISHDTRIRIVLMLRDHDLGFSEFLSRIDALLMGTNDLCLEIN